jgi:hypothetical protein
LLCPSSPSSLGEVSIITLVALTLIALNPLAFFIALVAVVFTTLAIAICRCLLSAANTRPLAARLSSADAGATAASRLPAEPLLPLMALYFIMADCCVVASAPAPSSLSQLPSSLPSLRDCYRPSTLAEESSLPSLRDCYRPSTLAEESIQKKEKAEKSIFIYDTTFKKNESGCDFQQIQIWKDRSQKQKKKGVYFNNTQLNKNSIHGPHSFL